MISGIGTTRRSAAADHHGSNWGKTGHAPPPAPIASGALGPIANRRSNLLWCTTRLFQQCGRMWSSALNTSLAVIPAKAAARLADRFEISVIMLKSELPHEAPNPVSKKAARVHIGARRRGDDVAARGARAAGRVSLATGPGKHEYSTGPGKHEYSRQCHPSGGLSWPPSTPA